MSIDMELDIECQFCGLQFKESLKSMPHGVALKCPFCHCNALHIVGDSVSEAPADTDFMEQFDKIDLLEFKTKL